MSVIQASTEIDLEDAAVAREKSENSTDRELVEVDAAGAKAGVGRPTTSGHGPK